MMRLTLLAVLSLLVGCSHYIPSEEFHKIVRLENVELHYVSSTAQIPDNRIGVAFRSGKIYILSWRDSDGKICTIHDVAGHELQHLAANADPEIANPDRRR